MILFKRKKPEEGTNEDETDEIDETPRNASDLFGGGSPSLPGGKEYIDAWRDAWGHPGRLPSHVYEEASNRMYPRRVPMTKCPEASCARLFSDVAVLDEPVRRDHDGVLDRIANVIRRSVPGERSR